MSDTYVKEIASGQWEVKLGAGILPFVITQHEKSIWRKRNKMPDTLPAWITEACKEQQESITKDGTFYVWVDREDEHYIQPRQVFAIEGVKFMAHSFDYDPDMTGVTFRKV